QRTLEATIAWSYDLLSAAEGRAFARLSVFAGGWTLTAAEEVCDADLDICQSLVDKSLVRAEAGRFRMLETIREYAVQRSEEAGWSTELRPRHASYFAELAKRAEPELTGPDQQMWLETLAPEHDNMRLALEWFAETPGEGHAGLRMATNLVFFWWVRGLFRDGLHWLEGMLALSGEEDPGARAGALWGAGVLWAVLGDEDQARPLIDESLAIAQRLGDESRIARALDVLGLLAFFRNDLPEAVELLEESIDLARRAGDAFCLADALGTVGSIYPLIGAFERSAVAGSEGLAVAREAGDRQGIRMSLLGLALAAARLGDLQSSRRSAEEGLAICRDLGDPFFLAYFLWILATVATDSGHLNEARAWAEEGLAVAREVEAPLLQVCALEAVSAVFQAEGDHDSAGQHLAEAVEIGRRGMVPGSYVSSALCALGEVSATRGDLEDAKRTLEESLSMARDVKIPGRSRGHSAESRPSRDRRGSRLAREGSRWRRWASSWRSAMSSAARSRSAISPQWRPMR
ncbi:MAG: tetratricopeptide repeat protein, partial [Actinomycetota bacterium]|nr:tetratricopeptide repeat protein [Actinomycetota bacterium]